MGVIRESPATNQGPLKYPINSPPCFLCQAHPFQRISQKLIPAMGFRSQQVPNRNPLNQSARVCNRKPILCNRSANTSHYLAQIF